MAEEREAMLLKDLKLSEVAVAKLSVSGMTCGNCVNSIESYVGSSDGIKKVTVSLIEEKAHVEFDPAVLTPAGIKTLIEDIGFGAEIITEISADAVELFVKGLDNASASSAIEGVLSTVKGVKTSTADHATGLVRVSFDPDLTGVREVVSRIKSVGYTASISTPGAETDHRALELEKSYSILKFCAVDFVLMVIVMILHELEGTHEALMEPFLFGINYYEWIMFALATPIQFWVGARFYVHAWKSLKNGFPDMNVLVVLGTSSAYLYSLFAVFYGLYNTDFHVYTFFDMSTMLIPIILLGKYLELMAKGRTSEAISGLLRLKVKSATLVTVDSNDNILSEEVIESDFIQKGDVLKVLPGSSIPADGLIIRGSSTIDESMITGESVPVAKDVKSKVIGGTINQSGMFLMKVTQVGSNSSLAQIIRLVQNAQTNKAPIQLLADRIAGYFVPSVVFAALLVFIIWYYAAANGSIQLPVGSNRFVFALTFCISVVVISCPCALGLATPTAVMVGTGIGAQQGILSSFD